MPLDKLPVPTELRLGRAVNICDCPWHIKTCPHCQFSFFYFLCTLHDILIIYASPNSPHRPEFLMADCLAHLDITEMTNTVLCPQYTLVGLN